MSESFTFFKPCSFTFFSRKRSIHLRILRISLPPVNFPDIHPPMIVVEFIATQGTFTADNLKSSPHSPPPLLFNNVAQGPPPQVYVLGFISADGLILIFFHSDLSIS